jgi:hypothetical protein
VNRRMVDKPAPLDFLLNPGNYMIDITLSGYKPVHRVVTLERNGKIELNENMEPQWALTKRSAYRSKQADFQ